MYIVTGHGSLGDDSFLETYNSIEAQDLFDSLVSESKDLGLDGFDVEIVLCGNLLDSYHPPKEST